ncbi:MAG TPA: hypothetical protein VGS27_12625 [Candidatus Sulfotelmatobacter sp.]|nr:hypothetical protein [Candidatus Sulfotelmatobacter sp.]
MLELESMAVEMPEVEGHPNRVAFHGVLTLVDVPSDRTPSGSHGKRVVLTRRAAEKAIPSLIGMAVDYAPSLDKHDQQRKVGVITSADVVGRNLEVGGFLYAKDFPEIVEEIARFGRHCNSRCRLAASATRGATSSLGVLSQTSNDAENEPGFLRGRLRAAVKEIRSMIASAAEKHKRAESPAELRAESASLSPAFEGRHHGNELGMSFEVTNVNVLNPKARILRLIDVTFTGAAILRKSKAAYQDTWIELT